MIEDFDYKSDVSIDESALDVEWLQQAELTMKYCQLEAKAEREYEDAKENLDIVEAKLDEKIRSNPDKFNLQKSTEGEINNTIKRTKKYQRAKKKVAQAKYQYNMAKSAVRAIYSKKDALENLVRLHGQQYFAGPSTPRNISKQWVEVQKQKNSNRKVAQKSSSNVKRTKGK